MNNILVSKNKEICYPIHPTDTDKWNNHWKLLMNNIRDYKFLKAKLYIIFKKDLIKYNKIKWKLEVIVLQI